MSEGSAEGAPRQGGGPVLPSEAAALLGQVDRVRRRARDAQHHIWLFTTLLGLALVAGSQVDRPLALDPSPTARCVSGLEAASGGSCVPVTLTPAGSHVVPAASGLVMTGALVGKVPPAWSIGTSRLYWVVAIAVAFAVVTFVQVRRVSQPELARRLPAMSVALLVAAATDIVFHVVSALTPLANVVAVGVAIAIVALAERSRALALVDTVFLLTAGALFHVVPDITLSKLVVPSASVVQAVAGLVLVCGGVSLRRMRGSMSIRLSPAFRSSNLAGGGG